MCFTSGRSIYMDYTIKEISSEHDDEICHIIKKIGAEYGAIGEGFGPSDLEVTAMSQNYNDINKSRYLIAIKQGKIVGGCGIASFNNSNQVCELRKLFLLQEDRGTGLGKKLTEECLAYAKSKGYNQCYLDTLSSMKVAISLYKKLGFTHLAEPLAGTIHNSCDIWMIKDLEET